MRVRHCIWTKGKLVEEVGMKLFGLMWSNLFRKRTRTVLTMLSVAIAFLLFMLLRTVAGAFETGGNLVGVDRLIASPKYSIVDSLPVSQKQQILAIDGVAAVTQQQWFGGVYQDPKNFFPKYPVEPREFFAMYEELEIDPAAAGYVCREAHCSGGRADSWRISTAGRSATSFPSRPTSGPRTMARAPGSSNWWAPM